MSNKNQYDLLASNKLDGVNPWSELDFIRQSGWAELEQLYYDDYERLRSYSDAIEIGIGKPTPLGVVSLSVLGMEMVSDDFLKAAEKSGDPEFKQLALAFKKGLEPISYIKDELGKVQFVIEMSGGIPPGMRIPFQAFPGSSPLESLSWSTKLYAENAWLSAKPYLQQLQKYFSRDALSYAAWGVSAKLHVWGDRITYGLVNLGDFLVNAGRGAVLAIGSNIFVPIGKGLVGLTKGLAGLAIGGTGLGVAAFLGASFAGFTALDYLSTAGWKRQWDRDKMDILSLDPSIDTMMAKSYLSDIEKGKENYSHFRGTSRYSEEIAGDILAALEKGGNTNRESLLQAIGWAQAWYEAQMEEAGKGSPSKAETRAHEQRVYPLIDQLLGQPDDADKMAAAFEALYWAFVLDEMVDTGNFYDAEGYDGYTGKEELKQLFSEKLYGAFGDELQAYDFDSYDRAIDMIDQEALRADHISTQILPMLLDYISEEAKALDTEELMERLRALADAGVLDSLKDLDFSQWPDSVKYIASLLITRAAFDDEASGQGYYPLAKYMMAHWSGNSADDPGQSEFTNRYSGAVHQTLMDILGTDVTEKAEAGPLRRTHLLTLDPKLRDAFDILDDRRYIFQRMAASVEDNARKRLQGALDSAEIAYAFDSQEAADEAIVITRREEKDKAPPVVIKGKPLAMANLSEKARFIRDIGVNIATTV